jgi:hypothetical protein
MNQGRLFPNHMNYLRIYWQEMLEAVFVVHSENERIVHGDIKPQNFVFVKGKNLEIEKRHKILIISIAY